MNAIVPSVPVVYHELVVFARQMARDSLCNKRHAALVVKGTRVLGAATNMKKTHIREFRRGHVKYKKIDRPRVIGFDVIPKSYHAEKTALMRANGNVKGAVLYSFRDGEFKRSRPCKDCIRVAKEHGIRYIIYDNGPRESSKTPYWVSLEDYEFLSVCMEKI